MTLVFVAMAVATMLSVWPRAAVAREGSSDTAGGYQFTDESEPDGPTYDYIDIADNGGTNVGIFCDDCSSAPIDLPFTTTFYGITSNQVRVSSNGFLLFGPNGDPNVYTNASLPLAQDQAMIPFWDDLDLRGRRGVLDDRPPVLPQGDPAESCY